MAWTRALHLKQWADTEAANGLLPLLVRRLIRGIVPRDATVNFPANEQNHRPGFDGIVETSVTCQYIPDVHTVWEMGVDRVPKNKADSDFKNRCETTSETIQRNNTFVFVTPREWQNKDEWASTKKTNSEWKGVVAFDCNDLEHWLECIAVLKKLVNDECTEGWRLVLSLLSPLHMSTPTHLPRWQNWADGAKSLGSQRNDSQYKSEITTLLMDAAGNSVTRWASLVESLMVWDRARAKEGLNRLDALTSASENIIDFSVLWRALDLIVRSQPISSSAMEAKPSLGEMWNQLVTIRDCIVPSDNITRSQWLFEHDVTIPGIDQSENFDEYQTQLQIRRTNAIQLISKESSWTGVRQLASLAQDAHTIGWTLAHEKLLKMSKSLLLELASSPNNPDRSLAVSFVSCSFQRDGAKFLENTFPETASPEIQANILSALPSAMGTWLWIDEHSPQMFNGFRKSLCNGRGITSRCPTDGGKLEHDEAGRYRDSANIHQSSFPLVANCLRDLASFYEEDAKNEDAQAERAKLGR